MQVKLEKQTVWSGIKNKGKGLFLGMKMEKRE
jgi:hypothetical protein